MAGRLRLEPVPDEASSTCLRSSPERGDTFGATAGKEWLNRTLRALVPNPDCVGNAEAGFPRKAEVPSQTDMVTVDKAFEASSGPTTGDDNGSPHVGNTPTPSESWQGQTSVDPFFHAVIPQERTMIIPTSTGRQP